MARTNLSKRQLGRTPQHKVARDALYTKLAEHDTAIDALEGGTTSSVVTIHPVRGASTANVANLAAFTVANDGVTLVAGDRVLLKDQSAPAANGIYVVGTVATGTAPLTRATDFDASAEVKPNSLVVVSAGTANANTVWQLAITAAPTIGSTSLTFSQIFNATQLALTTSAAGATKVGVYDTGTYYTGTTVEAVLAEIYARLIATDATGLASVQGIRDVATIFTATTVEGALAEVKALADAAIALGKRTVSVVHGDLSGASTVINIGAALPANAVVLAHEYVITEQFAGEADTTLQIGGTDTDAIVANFDLDATATGSYTGTLGVHPTGRFSSQQLVATFAATALGDLTAGEMTITVWYSVLA
jgi:hypothetical protein